MGERDKLKEDSGKDENAQRFEDTRGSSVRGGFGGIGRGM
jgi:hypothetical protein